MEASDFTDFSEFSDFSSSEVWALKRSSLATRSSSLLSDLFFDFDLDDLELELGFPWVTWVLGFTMT